jgi:hypothetical protein
MVRSIGAGSLLVLGFLALFVANLLIWLDSSIFDSEEFAKSVDSTLDQPAVQQRIGEVIAAEAVEAGDLTTRVQNRLPEEASFLSPIIETQLQDLIARLTQELLARGIGEDIRNEITIQLHQRLVGVLEDDDQGLVRAEGNQLVLNLAGAGTRVFDRLGITPPARLQGGAEGSSTFGQVVLLDDVTGLDQASFFVTNRQTIQVISLAVAIAALVGAIFLSRDRRRGVSRAGYAVLLVGLLTILIVAGVNLVLEAQFEERIAARELLKALEDNLRVQSLALLIAGICIVVLTDRRLIGSLDSYASKGEAALRRAGTTGWIVGGVALGGLALLFA